MLLIAELRLACQGAPSFIFRPSASQKFRHCMTYEDLRAYAGCWDTSVHYCAVRREEKEENRIDTALRNLQAARGSKTYSSISPSSGWDLWKSLYVRYLLNNTVVNLRE